MTQVNQIFVVGRPNSGKSTLFNQLTGLNQKTGNFAGATINLKTGKVGEKEIIDIPGLNSLKTEAPEEMIARNALVKIASDKSGVLYVLNGTELFDGLMLFTEVADLQIPSCIAVNFKDDLERNKIDLNYKALEDFVGCPVFAISASTGDGMDSLRRSLRENHFKVPHAFLRSQYEPIASQRESQDGYSHQFLHGTLIKNKEDFNQRKRLVDAAVPQIIDILTSSNHLLKTKAWDKILLHPIWGVLIFLSVMYLTFQLLFSIASYPMDWIDGATVAVSSMLAESLPEGWINRLLSDALIPGIGGVVIFIPQIAILFLLLGLLEHSGYLSRISFIADNFLRKFGLSGRSVIPLMSSWACAIPAIMSAKMIRDPKERLALIMAAPLMTCSARLPVYAILIAILIPDGQGFFFNPQGIALLALYLLGFLATLVVALVFSRNSRVTPNPLWTLDLPKYRWPNIKGVLINVYIKTKTFVLEAGKIIVGISIVLWLLASFSPHDTEFFDAQYEKLELSKTEKSFSSKASIDLEYSYLGYIGKGIEPIIRPLGYDWKIGIALLSSFAAREVFVGTMATIYSIGSTEEMTIVERLKEEKNSTTLKPAFDLATSVSLLMFYVFALQCMSTMAVVKQETGDWKFVWIQFGVMLVLAYFTALISYQLLS